MAIYWLLKRGENKKKSYLRDMVFVLPAFMWLGVMLSMPHKEQRFLFVIYPLIALAAAIAINCVVYLADLFIKKTFLQKILPKNSTQIFVVIFCFIFLALSFSRASSLTINYSAPLSLYNHLYENELKEGKAVFSEIPVDTDINICVGKEWYRFPSSFFIPSKRFKYSFVKSSFGGLLPKPFADSPNATSIIPTGMNNMNREETDRYVK